VERDPNIDARAADAVRPHHAKRETSAAIAELDAAARGDELSTREISIDARRGRDHARPRHDDAGAAGRPRLREKARRRLERRIAERASQNRVQTTSRADVHEQAHAVARAEPRA